MIDAAEVHVTCHALEPCSNLRLETIDPGLLPGTWTAPGISSASRADCAAYEADFEARVNAEKYPWNPRIHRRSRIPPASLYGTAWAQDLIWRHQHPQSCSEVKYLRFLHRSSGIGSNLHTLGQALSLAMNLGRVLVLSARDPRLLWHNRSHCSAKSWECWFLPLTSCEPRPGDDVKVTDWPAEGRWWHKSIPAVFEHLLECSAMRNTSFSYWWRSQSMAYIVRFNARTRRQLDGRRLQVLRRMRRKRAVEPAEGLEEGTVAVHVRRGDKWKEMNLVSFADYRKKVLQLAAGYQGIPVLSGIAGASHENLSYPKDAFSGKSLFVSTDDALAAEAALELAEQGWSVTFAAQQRQKGGLRFFGAGRGNLGNATELALESFLSLELALEADAWVCTLASNWCRLIDELRLTVAAKAAAPYASLMGSRRYAW